jgi:hypothetical protein
MTIYDDMQILTGELMEEFEQGLITLVQLTAGTGPADNPGEPTEASTKLIGTAKGVSSEYVDQGFAVSTDLMVTTSVVSGVTPNSSDFIELDGTRFKVIKDVSVPAIGTKVAWKFIVRKG